jgi:hypothetical protein
MAGLRRCVICTGLSVFKRNMPSIASANMNNSTASGALQSPTIASPPPRTFTCYGVERLAYAQALPSDDARLHQPDVALMWCLGKSVFLLQSSAPGSVQLPEGRAWVASASPEVPISYRGISQSLTAEELARMPAQSSSSHLPREARPAIDSSRASDLASATQRHTAPSTSLSQLLADLKPYVQESVNMLRDGIFTAQSHQHFASVVSQSALSWNAHCSALRMLQAGHDKACSMLLSALRKLLGSGGS